jgi:hypothetical protein
MNTKFFALTSLIVSLLLMPSLAFADGGKAPSQSSGLLGGLAVLAMIAVATWAATMIAKGLITLFFGRLPNAKTVATVATTLMLLVSSLAFADGGRSSYEDSGCGNSSSSSSADWSYGGGATASPPDTAATTNSDEVSDDDTVLGCGKARHSNFTMVVSLLAAVILTLVIARILNKKPTTPS